MMYISNQEYFATYDPTIYHNPPVAVDVVLVNSEGQVFLIERKAPPEHLKWALPGSFVHRDESLIETVQHTIQKYVPSWWNDIPNSHISQIQVFDGINRDIRDRVISVAHLVTVKGLWTKFTLYPIDSDKSDTRFVEFDDALKIVSAFDHADILKVARQYLADHVWDLKIMSGLLPDSFTLREYKNLVEKLTGKPINASNFRKRALTFGIIEPEKNVGRGKTTMYRFTKE